MNGYGHEKRLIFSWYLFVVLRVLPLDQARAAAAGAAIFSLLYVVF